MNCKRTQKVIHAELFGERDESLAEHVKDCPVCAEAVESICKSQAVLNAAPGEKAPPELWSRIEGQLARPTPTIRALPVAWRWTVPIATAAGLAIAVGLWSTINASDPGQGSQVVLGGIPDAEFYLSEHLAAEESYVFFDSSKER